MNGWAAVGFIIIGAAIEAFAVLSLQVLERKRQVPIDT